MSSKHVLSYRSPISKLVRFFSGSRDKWKAKCQAAKRENKSLKYRLQKMTERRDAWKAKAKQAVASEYDMPSEDAGTLQQEEQSKDIDPCGPWRSRKRPPRSDGRGSRGS